MNNPQRMMWLLRAEGLALLAYALGPRIGAVAYNATHSYLGAALLLAIGLALSQQDVLRLGLIWFARIGFDRTLGYGLKYFEGFRHTHLGVIGKQRQ